MASLSVLEGLFAKLLELPVGERERAIAEWTAGRPELRAELEAMLRHLDEAEKFLEVDAPRGQEGRMFGPWRAERRIGMGGMGDVYLASRADGQFEMQVALKLLGAGLGSEAERKRFLEERQILATLDHPYIARLLDGGISEEGQPYLVMELVDGVALGKAIEGMARRERLRVMRDVVAAVEDAHRNLVVHADLKPSNVMVRRDGIVKLVDFGIAWVEREGFEAARGMSAQYASPEQKRGERPTVASDVYGLGVLLGEVMGREDEELRAIADRATRDSAAERYATVEALGRELERLADGRAVEAMGKAPVYRVKKYVVRHWFAVSAAALVVAFAGYAVEQKIQAEQHFNELKRAARIMVFDVYEGIQYLNPPPEVVERIVESSQQVLEALAQTRDPDAGLRFDIASAEERLAELLILNGGDRKRADALLDHAVGMARRLVVERPDSGSYHRLLASGLQYVAQRERERGRREAALAALREMEQHVRRAIALPEPRSRDWMYLSLIDLKRGEIEGAASLRAAVEAIARREKESPFEDGRHEALRMEALLRLAGTGDRAALAEYEQVAQAMRAAGRVSAMTEMRLGVEVARVYAQAGEPKRREASLERARAAADLARQTLAASPNYHVLAGEIAEELGAAAQARTSYERAMQLNQFHEPALRRLFELRLKQTDRCAQRNEIAQIARRLGEEERLKDWGCATGR